MKLIVEKLVDGKQEFEVVDAKNAIQAINYSDGFVFGENGEFLPDKREIGYVGVYEMGQTNLLGLHVQKNAVHSFYHKKL